MNKAVEQARKDMIKRDCHFSPEGAKSLHSVNKVSKEKTKYKHDIGTATGKFYP